MGKRVVVTGATGQIGRSLITRLLHRGDEVTALVHNIDRGRSILPQECELIHWDAEERANSSALTGRDGIIHLAGEPIAQRWSPTAKVKIRRTREHGTRNLIAGIQDCSDPPKVLVSASAVGYYGPHGTEELLEDSPAGTDFLAIVCRAWESASEEAQQLGLRVATLRTGVVLSKQGGALEKMLPFFKLGLGGPIGGGNQFLSWIHLDDLIDLYLFTLDNQSINGAINATAPNPVSNSEFSRTLGRTLRRPAILPVPKVALKILYGEMSSVITNGQRALPKKALEYDFNFKYTNLANALESALADHP